MAELDFKDAYDELCDSFIRNQPHNGETELVIGKSFLDFILQVERLRHGLTESGADRDRIDARTIALLENPDKLGPDHSVAEATFRRLVRNPKSAIRYVEAFVEARSLKQSLGAQKERPRARDPITQRIEKILEGETTSLPAKEVGRQLILSINDGGQGGIVFDGDEYKHVDGWTLKAGNLASRVSDARKRKMKRDLG